MKKQILLFPGGWSKAENSFAPQIESLKNNYEVILPNIHKFNTINQMSKYVVENYTNVCAIIGLSMGGFIAQDILTNYPNFSQKAILMGTFAHKQFEESIEAFKDLVLQVKAGKLSEICSLYAQSMLSEDAFTNKPNLVEHIKQIPLLLGKDYCINHSEACIQWQGCIDKLSQIKAQTLVLNAELDSAVPVKDGHQLVDLIPDASLKIIKDSGHFMTLEQPQIVNELILNWLEN